MWLYTGSEPYIIPSRSWLEQSQQVFPVVLERELVKKMPERVHAVPEARNPQAELLDLLVSPERLCSSCAQAIESNVRAREPPRSYGANNFGGGVVYLVAVALVASKLEPLVAKNNDTAAYVR